MQIFIPFIYLLLFILSLIYLFATKFTNKLVMFVMLCATPTSLQSDRIISMLIAVTNLEEEEEEEEG